MKEHHEKGLVLVLDIGTTGTKALLFDASGDMKGESYTEYTSIYHAPKIIDHDPETWITAIKQCVEEIKKNHPDLIKEVVTVSVTSQRATLLPVDQEGLPLADAILWQDKRTVNECQLVEDTIGEPTIYEKTGLKIDPYFSLPKLLWFRDNKPEVYNKTAYFLTTHDFVIHQLTGEFKTEWTQASRTMIFNINTFEWDSQIINELNLDADKMVGVYPPGTVAGQTTVACSEKLGIPAGIPVVMAGGDQQAAAVGMGVVNEGTANISLGTGGFVVAPVNEKPMFENRQVIVSASAIPGNRIIEAGIFTAGATYRWLRDNLLDADVKNKDESPYDLLDKMAAESQPGSNGVLHIPHYTGSAAPYWNQNASGVLFNITLGTQKNDIVRSYLEGLSFEVRKNLMIINEALNEISSDGLTSAYVGGGLARSDFFNQLQANVYGLPITPGKTEQSSGLGAAIIAFVNNGTYNTFQEAVDTMVQLDDFRKKYPNTDLNDLYKGFVELHDNIYQALNNAGIYDKSAELMHKFEEVEI